MGVDIDAICESLENELRIVRYDSHEIKLTSLIASLPSNVPKPVSSDFEAEITFKIEHANALCNQFNEPSTLARLAVQEIRRIRLSLTDGVKDAIPDRQAYVIRQLKRPQEVTLLRRIYGKQFVLISAYGAADARRAIIAQRLKRTLPTMTLASDIAGKTEALMERDAEEGQASGQHLRDTFHLGDVFIDGINRHEMDRTLHRFIQAFFGRTDLAPSKQEYGMYAAKSASLRSSDLSRQVGAAIFTDEGELVTQGCNEVPKAFGGTYWDGEKPDHRDVILGYDPNDSMKKEVLRDILERLQKGGMLSDSALQHGTPAELLDVLCKSPTADELAKKDGTGSLASSSLMDLTEFGRIVHAEMCAVCDAARLGRSVKNCTLYCTTFPCHNCTKHLLAAGIKRVVYIEPYPKSKAPELHSNEIEIESDLENKVSFVPFLGISPFRYRDIFQKGKRKNPDGKARRWYSPDDVEQPMLDTGLPSYLDLELASLGIFVGDVIPVAN